MNKKPLMERLVMPRMGQGWNGFSLRLAPQAFLPDAC